MYHLTYTTNEPLQENLEDSCANNGVEETEDRIVQIPKATDANRAAEEDEDRDKYGEHGSSPDRYLRQKIQSMSHIRRAAGLAYNLVTQWIGEFGVDDFAILKSYRERAAWGRIGIVDLIESIRSLTFVVSIQNLHPVR